MSEGAKKKQTEAMRFSRGVCQVAIGSSKQRVGEIKDGHVAIGGALAFQPEDLPSMLVLDQMPRAIFADEKLAGLCSLAGHSLAILGQLHDQVWRVRRFAADADAAWMAKMDKHIEQTLTQAAELFRLMAEFTGAPRVDHSNCPPEACSHRTTATPAPVAPTSNMTVLLDRTAPEVTVSDPDMDPNKVVH